MMARLALQSYIRSFGIENFSIAGDQVRVGSRFWRADECRCELEACEGWAMIPVCSGEYGQGRMAFERPTWA
jgi:hypothetical protein